MAFEIPDACTLSTADLPLRLGEFDDLFATAVHRVDRITPTRTRLRLTGPAGLEATVRDLTARETACCSFFTFTITLEPAAEGETVILDVEVPAQHAAVVASLTQRATAVAAGRTS